VVEEDAVASEHAVSLAVVDHDPVSVQFGDAVWGSVGQKLLVTTHLKAFRIGALVLSIKLSIFVNAFRIVALVLSINI